MGETVYVVGAGPAGAAAAYFLSLKGYDVIVYDNSPYPGFKPCGWAVPLALEKTVRIPRHVVLNEIRGFRVYVDGEKAHEYHGKLMGYIVDKPKLISYMLESATLTRKTVSIRWAGGNVLIRDCPREDVCIVATGSITPPSHAEFINAIQAEVRVDSVEDYIESDTIELWFEGSLVGYYWVFPRGEKRLDVGVGGYKSFPSLRSLLMEFIRKRLGLKVAPESFAGARINVAGVKDGRLTHAPYVIGEAAGFVYPLTGEGIRPSVESGYAIASYISSGANPEAQLQNTIKWINRQRKLLDKVLRASPRTRSELMKAIPTELLPLIGMGELSTSQLLKLLAKSPARIVSLIKALTSD